MSTSIHMHLEVKKDDQWLHFAAPNMYYDGVFFDLIAGIHVETDQIVPLRGLPEAVPGSEISEVTQFCYEQDQQNFRLHHIGWLGADELILLQKCLNDQYDKSKNDWRSYDLEEHYFHTFINGNAVALHQGWDDIRLIFWFDN